MRPYVERRRFPTLLTLHEIYSKLGTSLQDVQSMPPTVARDTLETLVQVLQEGPDYLIDIILISAIISQAEMIDTSYASDLRHILDRAIDSQTDLETFRRATEAIASVSSGIPTHLLDNQQAEEAYEAIAVLVKQLQVRVATSVNLTPTPASSIAGSGTVTPVQSPLVSATTSPAVSPTPSVSSSTSSTPSDPNFKSMDISDLQANYGTGVRAPASPLPGLSSYRPSPAPSTPKPAAATPATPDTSSETSQEIWEYRDQLLTRSALDLVLAQEALAQADSSGQYAGEVSWDDLRKAWIPKWVEKLKPGDLADDDEVPDLTPGGFKIKTKDEWGNKIGWYGPHKEMYYEEEPKFELKEK
nr:uncharacterized protein CI109_004463 [Kwoniella shandongensis]KAA5527171.1 hypothetical protein CI109_004463 [Kwoniella shandongensis]